MNDCRRRNKFGEIWWFWVEYLIIWEIDKSKDQIFMESLDQELESKLIERESDRGRNIIYLYLKYWVDRSLEKIGGVIGNLKANK